MKRIIRRKDQGAGESSAKGRTTGRAKGQNTKPSAGSGAATQKDARPLGAKSMISDEEARLWSHVTRDAAKLSGKATARIVAGSAGRFADVSRKDGIDESTFADMLGVPLHHIRERPRHDAAADKLASRSSNQHQMPLSAGPAAAGAAQNHDNGFDKHKLRKVAKGRIKLDARLDLHGMRQREAHSHLRSFLFDSHAKGHRLVLVITGKGKTERRRDDDDFGWGSAYDEPGVLKRNVPHWLAEADLAAIVVSHTAAHQRHGGDGALYIHLRKRLPHKPRC